MDTYLPLVDEIYHVLQDFKEQSLTDSTIAKLTDTLAKAIYIRQNPENFAPLQEFISSEEEDRDSDAFMKFRE